MIDDLFHVYLFLMLLEQDVVVKIPILSCQSDNTVHVRFKFRVECLRCPVLCVK